MPHDPKLTLHPLSPCTSGYRWALQFSTLEEALAAANNPSDVLWFFLSIAAASPAKKAALVPAINALANDLVKNEKDDVKAPVVALQSALTTFAANPSTAPTAPTVAPSTSPAVTAACALLQNFTAYAQPSVGAAQVPDLVTPWLNVLPLPFSLAPRLKTYFTQTIWAAIDAAS